MQARQVRVQFELLQLVRWATRAAARRGVSHLERLRGQVVEQHDALVGRYARTSVKWEVERHGTSVKWDGVSCHARTLHSSAMLGGRACKPQTYWLVLTYWLAW